jgi:stage V sporulation protein B
VTEGEIKREGFFSGFFTLTLSTVIVKIIGLIYKIPMLGLLGSEGMGYFNSAYEIYALFCVIATSGLPVAMSVMIAKHGEASAQRIYKSAKKIFLALGIVGMAVMIAFSHPFAAFLTAFQSVPGHLCSPSA